MVISHRVVVTNIHRIAETKHSISKTFEVSLPISEISGCLFQPLAEPFCIFCGLSVRVCGHKKHTDRLTGTLKTKGKT